MAPPNMFYRVFDRSSQSQYDANAGFVAGDRSPRLWLHGPRSEDQTDELIRELNNHLDWENEVPTPFISVYCSRDAAYACANGRVNSGSTGVTVAHIDRGLPDERRPRKVPRLAEEIDYSIPDVAWDNSEFEWIVLWQIPPPTPFLSLCQNYFTC
ncbi:MAG: hypothetical protein M1840_001788 [Geoglossum simile]|nr:MAG: hypothetical protein M1840_001788 [Geoglossum simile]